VLPEVVTDARRLLLDFLPFEERVISSNGIHIFRERYWTSELSQYVGSSRKYRVKYDARNISRVYVEVADNVYIDVPFADPSKEALPLFEHRYRRKKAKQTHRDEFDHDARFRAMADRSTRRKQSKRSTQTARNEERLRQAKMATADSHPLETRSPVPTSAHKATGRQVDYAKTPVVDWDQGDV